MGDVDFITITIHYGGKFEGEKRYIGGEFDVLESWDWSGWCFSDLVDAYVEAGSSGTRKFAFKVKSTDSFSFFNDEADFCDKLYDCVDWENEKLEVYVDCEDLNGYVGKGVYDEDCDYGSLQFEEEMLQEVDIFNGYTDDGVKDTNLHLSSEYEMVPLQHENAQDAEHDSEDGSVYEESDASVYEDDDAKAHGRMEKLLQYQKDCDPKQLTLTLGMRFKDVKECKAAVKTWAIVKGHNIKWKKSQSDKLQAVCEEGCKWKVFASTSIHDSTCVIRTYVDGHECVRPLRNRQCSAEWIAERFLEYLKDDPDLKAPVIQKRLKREYDSRATLVMCYRAKKKALQILHGTTESHYSKIRSYLAELQKRDREGTFLLKLNIANEEKPIFQRVYICFSALRKGFYIGCRKFLGFDACFLKTALGGALLAAVSKDCNGKMYPVAWAVVEKENEETWRWFMEKLFEDLGILDGFGWTFMSDKQKGLIKSVHTLAPNAEHRHCARHIHDNWKKKHSGDKFKKLFWNIVKSTNLADYDRNLKKLAAESKDAADDFLAQNPKAFCKSLITSYNKVDIVDNNISESFNSYVLRFRDHLLIDMLEGIRLRIMTRMYNLHKLAVRRQDVLCSEIREKLEQNLLRIRECDLVPARDEKYEVCAYNDSHIVDLVSKDCSCRLWELTGLPCFHALACIVHCRKNYVDFVDPFYYTSNWKACYESGLVPIRGEKDWPRVDGPNVLPPEYQKQPGRPKKLRKRGKDEQKRPSEGKLSKKGRVKMSCTKCRGTDHNAKTCKSTTTIQPAPKRLRGRSKKTVATVATDQAVLSRRRGRPKKNIALEQPSSSSTMENLSNQERLVLNREQRIARDGFGLLQADSGNTYVCSGRRARLVHEDGRSQNSQVIDGATPP